MNSGSDTVGIQPIHSTAVVFSHFLFKDPTFTMLTKLTLGIY